MTYFVFEHQTTDEQLIKEFNKSMKKLDLEPLFTDEHRSTPIKVDYLHLKSVANKTGASIPHLQLFSDFIHMSDDNKMYASVMLRTINQPTTFKSFMDTIKAINNYIQHGILPKYLHNTWNIVWYNEDLY